MTAEIREAIAALRPPAQAFERAKRKGYIVVDDQLGFIEVDLILPSTPANPDQLTLDD